MLSEVLHARHLAELSFLETALSESGLETNILEKSKEIPLHILLAGLEKDYRGRDRFLNFSFVPLPEEELEHIHLLQLYTSVPYEGKADQLIDVGQLLLAINCRLAIGHFSMKEDGEIYYRYVHCTSIADMIDANAFIEIVSLFVYMLNNFSEDIDKVANGQLSLKEALAHYI